MKNPAFRAGFFTHFMPHFYYPERSSVSALIRTGLPARIVVVVSLVEVAFVAIGGGEALDPVDIAMFLVV